MIQRVDTMYHNIATIHTVLLIVEDLRVQAGARGTLNLKPKLVVPNSQHGTPLVPLQTTAVAPLTRRRRYERTPTPTVDASHALPTTLSSHRNCQSVIWNVPRLYPSTKPKSAPCDIGIVKCVESIQAENSFKKQHFLRRSLC